MFGEEKYVFFAEENNNGEGKGGSFARGRSIRMIICKRPVNPDGHLQEACPSLVVVCRWLLFFVGCLLLVFV